VKWEFINTGFKPAQFNMEFDESLARRLQKEEGAQVFRLYGWSPPAISIGFNQNIEDFDIKKIGSAGMDIVRRPTGGRAILHAHELTYSIATLYGGESPRSIYRFINEALLRGLLYLGIHASLSQEETDFRKHYLEPDSVPCFSSSAKSEIHFEGKKLIGSAQRRFGSVILQHGSLLLGPDHRKIVDFLAPHLKASKKLLEETLAARTTDAESILGRSVSFEEAAAAIRRGFEESYGVVLNETLEVLQ